MNCEAVMIQTPQVDNRVFLGYTKKMLGYAIARAADQKQPSLAPDAHHLACIAAFKHKEAEATVAESMPYLEMLHYGFLLMADERDMQEILEATHGMPFVVVETMMRGMQAALVTGSLRTWRTAVRLGCQTNTSQAVRECFDKVYMAFTKIGLKAFFGQLTRRELPDHTFLLEGPDA
jgi:hypothetical protein